eukprot:418948_1
MMLLLFFVLGVVHIQGEKVRGTVNLVDAKGYAFLGKFCFQDIKCSNFSENKKHGAASGMVDIELTNRGSTRAKYKLVLYDDQANSWDMVYQKGLSCDEKVSSDYTKDHRSITLKPYDSYDKTIDVHQHIRPRWWWFYLTSCDGYSNAPQNLSSIDFELHFTQNTTSWLSKEVGSNDEGINIMYSVYLAVYIILFGVQLYAYYVYTIQQYIHQVIKLLTAVMGLQLFAILFHFADWILFTETGEHQVFFPIIASICEILASSVFLLLVMVLAQGWTVSRFEVVYPHIVLASVVIIAIVQCVLYIWTLIGLDEQSTTYRYNTIPQWIYGIVFILIGILFLIQCIVSYRNEPLKPKQHLYVLLAACFSFWFLWPLLRLVVGDMFSPWKRDIAVQAISVTVTTLTYLIMMVLMWPSHAHKYFNLTMVDTQQRILDSSGLDADAGTSINYKKAEYKVLQQDTEDRNDRL